jgi:hypothetical protein
VRAILKRVEAANFASDAKKGKANAPLKGKSEGECEKVKSECDPGKYPETYRGKFQPTRNVLRSSEKGAATYRVSDPPN